MSLTVSSSRPSLKDEQQVGVRGRSTWGNCLWIT
jgi:hypothetical protein